MYTVLKAFQRLDKIDCKKVKQVVLLHDLYCALFYHLGIENLPFELQRNFTLMRELDQRTQGKLN